MRWLLKNRIIGLWDYRVIGGALLLALVVTAQVFAAANVVPAKMKTAVFAGGCFWCMQSEFDSEKGVKQTMAGYSGGTKVNPTYEEVSSGTTGHREAIQVTYDPEVVSYGRLLEIFWSNVDPLDAKGQFCDKGEQYKAAIFVGDDKEKAAAELSAANESKRLGQPVVTDILTRAPFYSAEAYHQEYYKKSADKYWKYRQACGRDERLEELMKK